MKAVIFDFDGTIINTEAAVFESYKKALLEVCQYDLTLEEFSVIVGTSDDVLLNRVDETLGAPIDRAEFLKKAKEELYRRKESLVPRRGVVDIIKQLHEKGIQLALASSSGREWIDGFLVHHGLEKYFPIIFTADDVAEVKPNPELYIKSVEALGVENTEVFAVEDSANGSLAAVRAGIHCLVVPNSITKGSHFHESTRVIHSYQEFNLTHYLKKETWNENKR